MIGCGGYYTTNSSAPISGSRNKIRIDFDHFALIDEVDFDTVSRFTWYIYHSTCGKYKRVAQSNGDRLISSMGRLILGAGPDEIVAYMNGDFLDNRRTNLRICSMADRLAGKSPQKGGTSRYKGVSYNKRKGKWRAYLVRLGRSIYLGDYDSEMHAAIAYDCASLKLNGEFALTNQRAGLLSDYDKSLGMRGVKLAARATA